MRFSNLLSHPRLPNLANYWNTIQARKSYKEGILDYATGEWEIEIQNCMVMAQINMRTLLYQK